mmetsp:Transcript_11107/g.14895  ORF Transcript_11107/g.14895 Transcript_11107/m.14895 type:complete len:108 (+) Transcript_11107:236-559(+)
MRGSQWRKKKKMHNNEPLCRRTLEGAKGACMDRGPLAMYSAASRGFAPIWSSDSENEMIEESSHRRVVSAWRWRQKFHAAVRCLDWLLPRGPWRGGGVAWHGQLLRR